MLVKTINIIQMKIIRDYEKAISIDAPAIGNEHRFV